VAHLQFNSSARIACRRYDSTLLFHHIFSLNGTQRSAFFTPLIHIFGILEVSVIVLINHKKQN
jgi:hypothetical protein